MIALDVFKRIWQENESHFPLLTLDEFFDGNADEDSIAPNQWGYGRPSLTEMWDMFKKIKLLPNVAWVRVALHDDTEIRHDNGVEVLNLVGNSIVICTDMDSDTLANILDCDWLCSDGVIASEPALYGSCIPPLPPNYRCSEINAKEGRSARSG